MMNITNFNSRVIVHCAKVQRKNGVTQEIYITLDLACIWKCLPKFLSKLTACTVCSDTQANQQFHQLMYCFENYVAFL